jgi:MFS family permease
VVFGLASLFDKKWIFLFLSGIARLFSGMAVGEIGIISYEYIILIEPENMKQNISLTEMVSVVGFCVGSPLSYYLYEYLGYYVNMFLCTSFILTLNAF